MTTLAEIYRAVADDSGLDRDALMGGARGGEYAMPRQIVAWIAYQEDIKIETIMRVMGRTRAVVLVMIGHVDHLRGVDPAMHAQTHRLLGMFASHLAPAARQPSVDEVIRNYRARGATIPSIARFTGLRPRQVAEILGSNWSGD